MMIYLPAVFFGVCMLVSIIKYGWNIQAYMFSLYFLTGIASIMLDADNLYQYNCLHRPLGIIAPLSYCLLLYLFIEQFGRVFKPNLIKYIVVRNTKILDYVTIFYFAMFVVDILISSTNMQQVIANDAFLEVRMEKYSGDNVSFYNHLSGLPRYIAALTTFFFASSYFLQIIFFYNITFRNVRFVYNIMALCGSTLQMISSFAQADRSQFLYWIILFIFCYTLFRPMMEGKAKRLLIIYISPIIFIFVSYFVIVSVARWGNSVNGSEGGTIVYAGQNYINYCNFINGIWDTPRFINEIFPLISYITNSMGYFELADIVSSRCHMYVSVFPTFLGLIFSISGPIVLFFYTLIYRIVSLKWLRRANTTIIIFDKLMKMWILALVPILGVFGYFYMTYTATLAIFIWLYIGKKSSKQYSF